MEKTKIQTLLDYLDRLHLLDHDVFFEGEEKETKVSKTIEAVIDAINVELGLVLPEQKKVTIDTDKIKSDIKDFAQVTDETIHKFFEQVMDSVQKIKKERFKD